VDPVNPVCSSVQCTSTATLDPSLLPPDIADYRDPAQCTGQILIFNGRSMRCRHRGLDTSWHECCDADNTISDTVGSAVELGMAVKGVKTIYHTVQAAYYAAKWVELYKDSATIFSDINLYATSVVDNKAIQDAILSASNAASATQAATTAVQNYLASLFNPTTIAISVLTYAIVQLLSNGCDQEDITTATLNDSGYCYKVKDYCENDSIFGCLQDATRYCCFNSKLARIIHEQARAQLKSFSGNLTSTCRGFTPEEFQMIDFSKIDFSEYLNDIRTRSQSDVQSNITDKVQNYLNSLSP